MTCLLSIRLLMTWCTEAVPNVRGIHYTHVLSVMRYEFGGGADESRPGANLELQHLFPWGDEGGKRKWAATWAWSRASGIFRTASGLG